MKISPSASDPKALLAMLAKHVGPLFDESNIDDFKLHLKKIITEGDVVICKRISTIFACWSNIDVKFGDSVVVSSDDFFLMTRLRDYKFAIVNELAHLCQIEVSRETGKEFRINSQKDFQLFKELLRDVDKQVCRDRLTDQQAYRILMMAVEDQFTVTKQTPAASVSKSDAPMDSFNIIWCTLWSDHFMAQHLFDTENVIFNAPTNLAVDFLYYFQNLLGEEKIGHYSSDEKTFVSVKLTHEEIEKITDWILDFNFSTRKPLGLMMPDLYLDEEKIRESTVDVYCHIICQFIDYLLKHQSVGRDEIAKWAAENFMSFYANAYGEALRAKDAAS